MSERADPEAILQKIVAIFNTGDLAEVGLIFSPDYVNHQRPPGMEINAQDELRQIVTNARGSVRSLIVSIEDLLAERDKLTRREELA